MNKRHKISPATLVIMIAVLVMAVVSAQQFFLSPKLQTVDAHVVLENGTGTLRAGAAPPATGIIVEGEVAYTAERLREATALSVASALYVTTERMSGRRVASLSDLLSGLARAGLVPPGVRFAENQPAGLVSERGMLYVRYRSEPLAMEVLSVGGRRIDGPMILLRVPDNPEGVYYRAVRLEGVSIPPPFVPAAEVTAQGWTRERLTTMTLQR